MRIANGPETERNQPVSETELIRKFDDVDPGEDWRNGSFVLDEHMIQNWNRLFPSSDEIDHYPFGLSSVVVMRGLRSAKSGHYPCIAQPEMIRHVTARFSSRESRHPTQINGS